MRVLQIGKFYPPHMGGIETHLETLGRELRCHADVEVIVANDKCRRAVAEIGGVGVSRMARMFTVASTPVCFGMVRAIRCSEAHIVHLHTPNPFGALAYLLSGQHAPLILTWHSDVLRQKFLAKAFSPIERTILNVADTIVTTSENYVRTSPRLAAYTSKCRVIPYGIPLERFCCAASTGARQIRQRYGPRIVLTVGRMVYYKGFEYLIRAMKKVQATLLIIGDGPFRSVLHKETKELGISDRVEFLGEIPNELTVPYYQASDVFVLPSVARTEAFGIVQIEAMASGLPVINTALDSGVPAVSLNGLTGITVPPADADALATAINGLLDDPALRCRYGQRARERAMQEFSAVRMGRSILALYREVLGFGNSSKFESSSLNQGTAQRKAAVGG
jgi:glycosyltransferase involved in cell wall biosynthesis